MVESRCSVPFLGMIVGGGGAPRCRQPVGRRFCCDPCMPGWLGVGRLACGLFTVKSRLQLRCGCEAGSDPLGHLWVTWGVYLCAGKPPLADIILSHPPDQTQCDSVIGLAIPAMSGHIQYRGTASGDLYIGISGINRGFLS